MTPFNLRTLSGIIPPLATPLESPTQPDFRALERHLDHVIDGGAAGVFVLGSTGEGPSLSPAQRREVAAVTCHHVDGRIPVLVGICDPAAAENQSLAEYAAAQGAAGLVLTPPYYFNLADFELRCYLERTLPQLPLPVFLYNIPGLTKISFSLDVLTAIAGIPNVVGLKDSSGDMAYFASVRTRLPRSTGFRLFCGPEELLAQSVALGGDGGVCGGSNLFPRLYADLYQAAVHGDPAGGQLHARVISVSNGIYGVCGGSNAYLRGLKCAMELLGLCSGVLAEPLSPASAEERQTIQNFLLASALA